MFANEAAPFVSGAVVVVLAACAVALIGIARRRLLSDRARSAANAPPVLDLLQLPPLRRRSRGPEYSSAAYLDASEGGFVDAIRHWRTRVVLGNRAEADAGLPAVDPRHGGVVIVIGVNAASQSRVAAMNLALALGQLSRVLFIDGTGDLAMIARSLHASSDLSPAAPGPVYWPSGMIHRWSLPRLVNTPLAHRWESVARAQHEFEWVVLDVGGGIDVVDLLNSGVPPSATVALVGSQDMADVGTMWVAARSAFSDPQRLDGVVIVN